MDDYGVIKLQNVAYINSQIACALIELEAMKAENMQRAHLGQSMAYDEKTFMSLIDKWQLGHNSNPTKLNEGIPIIVLAYNTMPDVAPMREVTIRPVFVAHDGMGDEGKEGEQNERANTGAD